MIKAVKCPVCNGSGKVCSYGSTDTKLSLVPCHGCAEWRSRGWIVIEDNYRDPVVKVTVLDEMP